MKIISLSLNQNIKSKIESLNGFTSFSEIMRTILDDWTSFLSNQIEFLQSNENEYQELPEILKLDFSEKDMEQEKMTNQERLEMRIFKKPLHKKTRNMYPKTVYIAEECIEIMDLYVSVYNKINNRNKINRSLLARTIIKQWLIMREYKSKNLSLFKSYFRNLEQEYDQKMLESKLSTEEKDVIVEEEIIIHNNIKYRLKRHETITIKKQEEYK